MNTDLPLRIVSIIGRAPSPIKQLAKDTIAETIYNKYKLFVINSIKYKVNTPIGALTMVIPEYDWFITKYNRQMYEPAVISDLQNRISSDDIFYDIGARWGLYTLSAHRMGVNNSNIHSFEADYINYQYLLENIKGKSITSEKTCVSNINDHRHTSIDEYKESRDCPDVIKIDVEGAEYNVIRGMENTLEEKHPILYIEIHPEYVRNIGGSTEKILKRLRYYNYTVEKCEDHRTINSEWLPVESISLPDSGDFMIRAIH